MDIGCDFNIKKTLQLNNLKIITEEHRGLWYNNIVEFDLICLCLVQFNQPTYISIDFWA